MPHTLRTRVAGSHPPAPARASACRPVGDAALHDSCSFCALVLVLTRLPTRALPARSACCAGNECGACCAYASVGGLFYAAGALFAGLGGLAMGPVIGASYGAASPSRPLTRLRRARTQACSRAACTRRCARRSRSSTASRSRRTTAASPGSATPARSCRRATTPCCSTRRARAVRC